MTDLDKLIEVVEAGTIPRHDLDAFIPWRGLDALTNDSLDAYNGSLEAAKRLHDALLPGDARVNDLSQDGNGRWWIVIACNVEPHYFYGNDDNPARAWLLAILRAVKAKGEAS
jgi:hypothetical protein